MKAKFKREQAARQAQEVRVSAVVEVKAEEPARPAQVVERRPMSFEEFRQQPLPRRYRTLFFGGR